MIALALSACKGQVVEQGVLVTVDNKSGATGIVQLRAVVLNLDRSQTLLLPQVARSTPIDFPTQFSISVPSTRNGRVDIAIDGLDSFGVPVASGIGFAILQKNAFAGVSVDLLPIAIPPATGGAGGPAGTGGAVGSGGITGNGGAPPALGGTVGAGGVAGTGGVVGSGGAVGTGGTLGTGAVVGTGGTVETGGVVGAGGAVGTGGSGIGGALSTGGTVETGGVVGTGGILGAGGVASPGGTTGVGGTGATTASAGCGKTSTLTFEAVPGESGSNVGTGKGGYVTIQSGGQSRGFAMRLPDNYDNTKPYWLVFGFHWIGATSKDVDTGESNGYIGAHFGLQQLSNSDAFFVAPQGLNNQWANSGGQDLQFVDDMIKLIEDNYCIDTTRLYANGFSYGGGMTYAIACARAKVFRAVAIYAGAQVSGCTGGNDPTAYWQMAGVADTTISISMAAPLRNRFVKNNGCTGWSGNNTTGTTSEEPPRPPNPPPYLNPGGHICTDYTGCSAGHPVRWCVHQSNHGYAIADGTSDTSNSCATPPKTCSDACKCTWVPADVWKFFTSL